MTIVGVNASREGGPPAPWVGRTFLPPGWMTADQKDHMETLTFHVHGLDCADEVALLKKALAPLRLLDEDLSVDLLNGTLTVRSPEALDDLAILKALAAAGLRAERLTPLQGADPGG